MKIKSKAPARIDLAGGTLDIWPLFLFFENVATINFAIDQFAEVELEVGSESKIGTTPTISLLSEDRKASHDFRSYGELLEAFEGTHKAVQLPSTLWLHAKLVRHFFAFWRRSAPLKVTTRATAPAGSGLGGSSTLNIALCSALRKLTLAEYTDEELIGVARDLETTIIEIPAGVQDYWGAMYGGIQAIRMDAGRTHRKVFYKQKDFLEKHIILVFSGQHRNSGINNWAMFKGFIDKDPVIQKAFGEIVKATYRVEEALDKQDYSKLLMGIQMEWESRKKLAPNIATPEMLATIEQAKSLGAEGAKVCGAGGGGCFILVAPENKKKAVTEGLRKSGVQVIDFNIVEEGCVVTHD